MAAAKGLPIPPADEIPAEDASRKSNEPAGSSANLQTLTVPITSRTQSTASESNLSPSHPAFQSSPSSPDATSPPNSASPFKPKSKTLASLTSSSKNVSTTEITPREVQLPKDPNVNGLALEAYLYRDSSECPICFLYYPPYLNKTRCCDQAICSECFVQIKRPDPHPPEHHDDPSNPNPPPTVEEADPETLVSEPACCPYCQQAEFGVTYEAPPFRRGLAYADQLGSFASAMSSNSSINSAASPGLAPTVNRRRTTSVSADDATVITTDRVRPDWATKLANARSQAARRSAAATALHTAAYLMGNGVGADNRTFGFGGRSRFSRNRAESNGDSGSATPSGSGAEASRRVSTFGPYSARAEREAVVNHEGHGMAGQVTNSSSRRRARAEDIEDMMMMEAIRLSLAAAEEQKKKEDKQAAKDAKKKEKEEKKQEKKQEKANRKSMYGNSPASASALSVSLPFGRKRGNSEGSNLKRETTNQSNQSEKGKTVDRGDDQSSSFSLTGSSHGEGSSTSSDSTLTASNTINESLMPTLSLTGTAPDRPSHLRQMSNVSSPASSFIESADDSANHTPNGKEVDKNSDAETPPTESMFNFNSLTAMIDTEEEKASSGHVENAGEGSQSLESKEYMDESTATLKDTSSAKKRAPTPHVMIEPATPLAGPGDDSKQLGESMFESREAMGITQ